MIADTAKWAARRLATAGLYVLAIIGASSWDDRDPSWPMIILRLGAAAIFLSAAVRRTVTHWHEDREDK
jgi:hypothetical protein